MTTQTGMQQKEGTNYEGPKPVESTPISPYAAGAFAALASGLKDAKMQPVKKVTLTQPAFTSTPSSSTAPTVATAVTTLPDHPNLSIVIVDSGGLISSGSVSLHSTSAGYELLTRLYRENDGKTRFVTTQAVMNEIKDEKTRQMLETLPFKLEVVPIDPEAIKAVYAFAQLTGDAKTLSVTDIQTIALTYQFEKQYNGMNFIKTEPKRKQMDAATNATTTTTAASQTSASTSATAASSLPSSDSTSTRAVNAPSAVENEAAHESENDDDDEDDDAATSAATESKTNESTESKTDDADDGEGAWITPSNIHQHRKPKAKSNEPESTIAIITTDYAMQNVILQLGLRLLNLRGRSIRSLRSWQQKCHACGTITPDMSKEFCSACGHHTMIRVNVTINKAGLVRYWHGTRHLNKRGTIYSIPMPKAGRHANNLKLSEDVIDERIRKGGGLMGRTHTDKKERTPNQLFEDGLEFGLGKSAPQNNEYVFGYGKRNPNAVKGGGKKKGKK